MLCSEYSLVKYVHPETTIIPLRCRCWSCDHCRPWRASQLVREAKQGQPTLFVTLTSRRREGYSPDAAARGLVRAFQRVRREYIDAHGRGSFPFLAVFEATKQGWPHLHIVARCKWIDQRWLSRRMGALIGAPVVDVRPIKGRQRVAQYVAKYLGKDPHRFEGTKRYWRSHDYPFPMIGFVANPHNKASLWLIVREHWRVLAGRDERRGHAVEWHRFGATVQDWAPP